MSKLFGCLFFLGLVSVYLLFGCGAVTNPSPITPAANSFPVVVFSDLHFNPFYDPNLTTYPTLCTSADSSEWASLFECMYLPAQTQSQLPQVLIAAVRL